MLSLLDLGKHAFFLNTFFKSTESGLEWLVLPQSDARHYRYTPLLMQIIVIPAFFRFNRKECGRGNKCIIATVSESA